MYTNIYNTQKTTNEVSVCASEVVYTYPVMNEVNSYDEYDYSDDEDLFHTKFPYTTEFSDAEDDVLYDEYDYPDIDDIFANEFSIKNLSTLNTTQEETIPIIDDLVCWDDCETIDTESVHFHPATYAQAAMTNSQGAVNRITSETLHIKIKDLFQVENLSILQSRVRTPSAFLTRKNLVDLHVPEEMLDQNIMNFFENLSIGFTLSHGWSYTQGLVRKIKASLCTKCQGLVSQHLILDRPCVCSAERHLQNTNVIPENPADYIVTLSPGVRLSKTKYVYPFPVTYHHCGFASTLSVDSVAQDSPWIGEMLAIFGPHLFSFTKASFQQTLYDVVRFANQVGGIHPDIAYSIARMVCKLPNKRVVLTKLVKMRKTYGYCTTISPIKPARLFRHPLRLPLGEPLKRWRNALPNTEAQGLEPDEVTPPIQIPCTLQQSKERSLQHLERSPYTCVVCDISCTSQGNLDEHLRGRQHKKKFDWNPTVFMCEYCKVQCPNEVSFEQHLACNNHLAHIARYVTNAQGFGLESGISFMKLGHDMIHNVYTAVQNTHLLQKLWELVGGTGEIPVPDRIFLFQLIPFILRGCSLANIAHIEFFYHGMVESLSVPTKNLYLWFFLIYCLWTACRAVNRSLPTLYTPKEGDMCRTHCDSMSCEIHHNFKFTNGDWVILGKECPEDDEDDAEGCVYTNSQGIGEVFVGAFKTLIPGFTLTDQEKKDVGNNLRNHALAYRFVQDYFGFAKAFFEWVVGWLHGLLVETPASIKEWITEVDGIDEVYLSEDNSATTLRVRMAKYMDERRKIYRLLQTGKDMRRRLEIVEKDKFNLKVVTDRVKKLEAIVAKNSGSFVGAEGKLKPHVIYFWGDPKAGKSALVDHFYSDLFHIMEETPYNPAIDRYTINPITPYHDTYKYNRVVDFQDLLQVKADETRQTELYDLVHMADESPFPLNVAECSGKGSLYFCSDHMVISSNFDIKTRTREIVSLLESHEAILRRIDMYVEVQRRDNGSVGYDRSQMTFIYNDKPYSWDDFLMEAAKSVLNVRAKSMGVTSLVKDPELLARLDSLKTKFKQTSEAIKSKPSLNTPPEVACSQLPTTSSQATLSHTSDLLSRLGEFQLHEKQTNGRTSPNAYFNCSVGMVEESVVQGTPITSYVDFKEKITNKIDALEAACQPGYLARAYLAVDRLLGIGPYSSWELSLLKIRSKFAKVVAALARIVVNWGDIALAVTGLGYAFKHVKNLFAVKDTKYEGMRACSGGMTEFAVRKPSKHRPPTNRARAAFGEGNTTNSEGSSASNLQQVRMACVRNTGKFKGGRCAVHYFGVFDHVIAVPQHAFLDPYSDNCSLLVGGSLVIVELSKLDPKDILLLSDAHLVFINLKSLLHRYATFCDIRRRLVKDSATVSGAGVLYTTRKDINDREVYVVNIDQMRVLPAKLCVRMGEERFFVSSGIAGVGYSENGDCGSPWVWDHPTGALIVGLHVGGTSDKTMHATSFDRILFERVCAHFNPSSEPPVDTSAHGTVYDPPSDVNTVEVIGETDEVEWHMPRLSTLKPSLFYGVRPTTTAPAKLKPFAIDREGRLEIVSPLALNFKKNFVTRRMIEPQYLKGALGSFNEWYFPLPQNTDTHVLTLEEAVFGDPFNEYNKSISPQASIGWPWCERFTTRRELVSLQNKTISDELRASCARLLNGSKEQFLFIDMLKDERLPIEKVEAGKTRVFTILPIHLNLVLKQLFGTFVMYLQSRRHQCPIKVGIAQTPDEWGKFYHYLNNGGKYIAGDYSAFDKVLHFEVMMTAVEMANQFYADEYQDLRRDLATRVFTSCRYLDGAVYKSYGGMPSGCYLTAVFNSICNALYWYCFLDETGIDLTHHKDWFKLATFGDDHVVAVRDHPKINQISFGSWLKQLGLSYTSATKKEVDVPYTELEDVTFLKRTFRWERGYCWAPMPEENIMENIQWYRRTQTTKTMTDAEIADELLKGFELEAVHLGEARYNALQQELLKIHRTPNKRTFMQARDVFLSPSFTNNNTNMKYGHQIFENFNEETSCEVVLDNSPPTSCEGSSSQPKKQHKKHGSKNNKTAPRKNNGSNLPVSQNIPEETQGKICQSLAQGCDDISPAHEDETNLGSGDKVIKVRGLTKFVDQVAPNEINMCPGVAPVVDDLFHLPEGYFDMCKRWFKVGTKILTTVDPTGYPLLRVDPTNFLLSQDHIRTKLSSATFVRYSLELQVKVVSTKFHYGAFMVVWRPYYAAGLMRMGYVNGVDPTLFINSGHYWLELPDNVEQHGPYDNVHTASQTQHAILSTTARNTVTVEIPWNIPYQYVPTSEMMAPRYHPGYLDIYALTPVGPSDLDSPELLIFAAFKEIQGWGYQAYTGLGPKDVFSYNAIHLCKYVNKNDYKNLTYNSLWDVPVPRGSTLHLNDLTKWVRPETITKYATDAQGDPVEEKIHQTSGSWLLDLGFTILDTSRNILSLISPLGPLLGFFGLSRPPDSTPITRVIQTAMPMSNALGPDVCYSTAMNPLSLCTQDDTPEEKLITTLAGKPTYIGYLAFDTSNKHKQTFTFSPQYIKYDDTKYIMTPAALFTSQFRYWRTNIKWIIRFYSSSFVSVRMAIYIQYRFGQSEQGLCPTKIVDVAGDAQADIELPFLHPTPWYDGLDDYHFPGPLYTLTIEPITDIVSDEASSVSRKPVYCALWISFPGLQVAGPSAYDVDTDTLIALPFGGYEQTIAQGFEEDFPGLGQLKVNRADWGMNDIPASVYHLAKRYVPVGNKDLKPWLAPARKFKLNADAKDVACVNDGPKFQLYACMFRFYRSSVNVIVRGADHLYDTVNSYGEHFRDGPASPPAPNWASVGSFVLNPRGLCAARIPYRTNVSMLPTPLPWMYCPITVEKNSDNIPEATLADIKWSNPFDAFKPAIQTSSVNSTPSPSNKQYYVAAGDDLIYKTFIGVPLHIFTNLEHILPRPRS